MRARRKFARKQPQPMMIKPEDLLAPGLARLRAYPVPAAAGLIKLDAMENPYSLPAELREAWLRRLRDVALNRYPDAGAVALRHALMGMQPLPASWELLLGNGSDELILLLCMAVARPGAVVLAPEPSFVMYRHLAIACGLEFVGVPLKPDFSLDRAAMLAAIAEHRPSLIFLAQPNNPTANVLAWPDLEAICDAAPGLTVIDEAYVPYADADALALAARRERVLVLRTLSKWGLAGLRLGYLLGAGHWLAEIEKLRLPYNINSLTQISALFALEQRAAFDAQIARIRAERSRLAAELALIPGTTVFPSATNFLLCRVGPGMAPALFSGLREAGVLIKCLDGAHPLLEDCLRPTVGRPEENDALLHEWGRLSARLAKSL